ncbi:MAG: cytochrome c4 [Proteobacteria bacterium]|nr:cytochrome c4 [Pseudomonadota bacterium]
MKTVYLLRVLLIAIACAGWPVSARADEPPRILEAGEQPILPDEYASVSTELFGCFDCHGVSGESADPEFPILSGQHFYYLYVQLKDFKAGRRASEIMQPMVGELSKGQMKLIAQYFSEQEWPRTGFKGDPAITAKGETASGAGQCVQCHRGGFDGDSRVPRLAGQQRAYLFKTLMDFKNKVRMNSPSKSSLMNSFEEADIDAMAEYLADF